ncbi:MAG: hypothetical protein MHMPM18_001823 [Marteilia pararefringens]
MIRNRGNSHEKSQNSTTAHRSSASTPAALSACGPSHTRTVKNSTGSASATAAPPNTAACSPKAKSTGGDQGLKSNSRVFNMLEIQDSSHSTNNRAGQSGDRHLSSAVAAEDCGQLDFRCFTELTDDEERQRAKKAKHDKQLDSAYCHSL